MDYIGTPTSGRVLHVLVCALVHTRSELAHGRTASILSLTTDATYEQPPTALRRRYLLSSCLLKCRVNVYPVGAASRKLYALLLEFDRDITFSNLLSFLSFFFFSFLFFSFLLFFFTRVPVSSRIFLRSCTVFSLSLSISLFLSVSPLNREKLK